MKKDDWKCNNINKSVFYCVKCQMTKTSILIIIYDRPKEIPF